MPIRLYFSFSIPVFALVFATYGFFAGPAAAQATRTDLLFTLSTAVKEGDQKGILACFNLEGADDGMRRTIENAVTQICRWPTNHVSSTDRDGVGPLRTNRDGKTWSLNGDWQFQVHIFQNANQSGKGFVFPAGTAKNRTAILLLVEQTR